MKKFIKKNILILMSFVVGIIASGLAIYASTITASNVAYDKTKSAKYGATKDVVQEAVDELYQKASELKQDKKTLSESYKNAIKEACGGGTIGTPTSFATDSWATICYAVKTGQADIYAPKSGGTQVTRTVNLGDLGTHTLRVANTTPCTNEISETACGFVIEFADIITDHNMNDTSTNAGGYPASSMFTYINNTILPAMPEEIRNIMIPTTVVSGSNYDLDDAITTGNQYLYLLEYNEVFSLEEAEEAEEDEEDDNGGSGTGTGTGTNTATKVKTRILDYYQINNNKASRIKRKSGAATDWWLRTAYENKEFFIVDGIGDSETSDYYVAEDEEEEEEICGRGVSPAFRIG